MLCSALSDLNKRMIGGMNLNMAKGVAKVTSGGVLIRPSVQGTLQFISVIPSSNVSVWVDSYKNDSFNIKSESDCTVFWFVIGE